MKEAWGIYLFNSSPPKGDVTEISEASLKPNPSGKSESQNVGEPFLYGRAPCGVLVSAFLSVFHFPGP